MEKMTVKLHTIFLLVGPSGCGKSTYAKNLIGKLQAQLKEGLSGKIVPNVQYISSDDMRRDVLGYDCKKMALEMTQVSEQAFQLLNAKLEAVTTYPVNAQFVIIDSTALNADFRTQIRNIGEKNGYRVELVVFDYKNRGDYTKYLTNFHEKSVAMRHLSKFRQEVLPELGKKDFDGTHRVKSHDLSKLEVVISNLKELERCLLAEDNEYIFIGDTHGCLAELKALIELNGFKINDQDEIEAKGKVVVLIGDIVDKGYDSEGVVRFVYKNRHKLLLLDSNHDHLVASHFTNSEKTEQIPENIKKTYFDSIYTLSKEAVSMLQELSSNSLPFVIGPNFIATHAPCEKKYLGKLSTEAKRAQRNQRYPHQEEFEDKEIYKAALLEHISFLKRDAQFNQPFHIFGHLALAFTLKIKNKLGIDTGCATGGRLTSVIINRSGRPFFQHVKPLTEFGGREKFGLIDLMPSDRKPVDFDLNSLDSRERLRIRISAENRINFISGTVSPSDKDVKSASLETLKTAFDYYREHGIETAVVEKKYMGSRCNIYLSLDKEKCFATSRNGYKIHIDLDVVYENLISRFGTWMKENEIEMFLIDGELMPWSAMGRGLIEEQYKVVSSGIASELDLLHHSGFEDALLKVQKELDSCGYSKESRSLPSKVLSEKYGHQKHSNFRAVMDLNFVKVEKQKELYDVYVKQIEFYGADAETHFLPFAPLKHVCKDGSEKVYLADDILTEDAYKFVSDDEYLVVNLSSPDSIAEAESFYERVTAEGCYEGVVVKPEFTFIPNVAPFLKVRNPRYLHLIYGYDYMEKTKFEKLIRQKNNKGKIRTSIKEYQIGKMLLEIPYASITQENPDYQKLLASMIAEEKREKAFDPRL